MRNNTYLGDSDEHVVDEGLEGLDSARLGSLAVPHLNSHGEALDKLGLDFHDSEVDGHVAQVLDDSSLGSSDGNFSGFDRDLACTSINNNISLTLIGHGDKIFFKDDSHVAYIFFY